MSEKAAIIGGGPAGIASGRALKAFGIDFDIIEQSGDFGGLWNCEWPLSAVYDSAHFISSRQMSAFADYPMPKSWPDYPRHDQILSYVQDYARRFDLHEHARFNLSVEEATPEAKGWRIRTSDGETRHYRWLIAANGATWDARMPDIPGAFSGHIRHSRDYNSAREFEGKRVLVVGCGNSGADIAVDAAQRANHAGLSLRRGYWFIPKHINGIPTDLYASKQPNVPLWLRQFVLKRRLLKIVGKPERLGLPHPDHELLETHPLMNDQVLHHLRHGDLSIYSDVERLDGEEVIFTDGRHAAFDEIVFATGYDWTIPFLKGAENPFQSGRKSLPLCMFSPERDDLFFVSFIKAAGSSLTMFGEMSWIIARAIRAGAAGGAEHEKLRAEIARNDFDLRKGLKTVSSPRHEAYVNSDAWIAALQTLRKRMGWPKAEEHVAAAARR